MQQVLSCVLSLALVVVVPSSLGRHVLLTVPHSCLCVVDVCVVSCAFARNFPGDLVGTTICLFGQFFVVQNVWQSYMVDLAHMLACNVFMEVEHISNTVDAMNSNEECEFHENSLCDKMTLAPFCPDPQTPLGQLAP